MKKPGILLGALVGGLLTLPLLALLYIGQQIAGFPFVPFALFSYVRDYTPGGVITFTIDRMIDVITALNLGAVDTTAKTMEQFMGVLMLLVVGIIAGAIFFLIMRRVERRQDWLPGVILGLILGVPLTLMSIANTTLFSADTTTSVVWLLGLFLLWGYAHNYVYNRLVHPLVRMSATTQPDASVQQLDRRRFLISLGASTAAITVIGVALGSLSSDEGGARAVTFAPETTAVPDLGLPNAEAAVVAAPGTRPELTNVANHYRIDIAPVPPEIDGETWTLPFTATANDGSTSQLAEFTLDDLYNKFESMDQYITQGCISNNIGGSLISTVRWTGISMQKILDEIDLPSDATHLYITGADGFYETVALQQIYDDPSIMLAYAFNGEALPARNGYPVRIHIPNHYGMKQPKWITGVNVINHDMDGYWVQRGWDKEAFVQATSVIDTVAVNMMIVEGGQQLIPIGGIAWAGSRGISKVEVSVDDGDWAEAELREPLSYKTWVIWRYNWPYAEGSHTFAVRCFDGNGDMQITENNPPHPSGATGIDSVSATI